MSVLHTVRIRVVNMELGCCRGLDVGLVMLPDT